MEPNRARRTLLTLLGVLAALAVVAVAAQGEAPLGRSGGRRPGDLLLDTLLSLFLLLMAAGVVLFFYLLLLRKDALIKGGDPRARRSPIRSLFLYGLFLTSLVLALRTLQSRNPQGIVLPGIPQLPGGTATTATPDPSSYQPEFAWLPVGIVLLVVAAGLLAAWWSAKARRRARGSVEPTFAEELADVLAETLDDLRAEPDPRRAVIAAYARLERALAASGAPRLPAEAPLEYLERVLRELQVTPTAARRLTLLFERAKFSQHEIGPQMKDEAIAALETIQAELRAAERQAEAERIAAAGQLRERAEANG